MQILLVEDDLQLGAALHAALEQAGFRSRWVRRLAEASAALRADEPAALILDVNLPDGAGFSLLEEARRAQLKVPVLVITARDQLQDRLRGFTSGADDYIVKPFAVAELLARLHAVLRRSAGFAADVWKLGTLEIDFARHRVSREQHAIALSTREFDLMVELARCAGRVVAREILIQRVWGAGAAVSDGALEFQIHALRRKLAPVEIHTVRGVGYLLPL